MTSEDHIKQKEMELQIKKIVSNFLTKEARERLSNIRIVKPEIASQLEFQIFQLSQQGLLKGRLTESDLKQILRSLQQKRKTSLRFR